jgi:hypothetical protein
LVRSRRRPAPSTRNLRRYAGIIESIAARVPAILPVRFGTTFDDASELTLALHSRAAATRAAAFAQSAAARK